MAREWRGHVLPPWEKRCCPRPVRAHFFEFYRAPRVRSAPAAVSPICGWEEPAPHTTGTRPLLRILRPAPSYHIIFHRAARVLARVRCGFSLLPIYHLSHLPPLPPHPLLPTHPSSLPPPTHNSGVTAPVLCKGARRALPKRS
eukprot:gene18658-biopygen8413